MDIVNAYAALGTYRGAAALCGTTHKTVKRVLERRARGQAGRRQSQPSNTACVQPLIEERVRKTDGRISAKRLLPVVRAAGYSGSLRNLQRAVMNAKAAWKQQRRVYRPWVPMPGEHLVVDWGSEGGWEIFCAVLAWSRYRFVRVATDQTRVTTLEVLAECFAELDGVPGVVLTDRMGCLRAGTVANVVVPHPEYVQFATRYGFQPDFCEAADPESKGVVEALVGYAQRDLVVPAIAEGGWADLSVANAAARAWCAEANAQVHSEIAAVPAERLVTERGVMRRLPSLRPPLREGESRKVDRTGMVRFGSARYAVPSERVGQVVQVRAEASVVLITQGGVEIIRHQPVGPGEVALGPFADEARRPTRGVRPRTATEVAFLGLGGAAEAFLRAAAAAGTLRLEAELAGIAALDVAWGREALKRALERATTYRRFTAADVRAILAAGLGVPEPTRAGQPLALDLPEVAERPLTAYALTQLVLPMAPTTAPAVGGAIGPVGGRA
jgi:transposase/plasmid stability protein